MIVLGCSGSMARPLEPKESPLVFEDGTGLIWVQTPVAMVYFHTSPEDPSYGPPVLLVAMYRMPLVESTTPWWAMKPVGWPATRVHVEPPLVLSYTVFCRSATPAKMVWVALPVVPVALSKATQVTPSSALL